MKRLFVWYTITDAESGSVWKDSLCWKRSYEYYPESYRCHCSHWESGRDCCGCPQVDVSIRKLPLGFFWLTEHHFINV